MHWRLLLVVAAFVCLWPTCSLTHAQIYRWDNGEVIPGTEGITPGPGTQLPNLNLQFANLPLRDLTNSDFTHSDLSFAQFSSTSLSGVSLTGTTIYRTIFSYTTSRGFTFPQLASTASYQAKDLRGVNLAHNDLTGWSFRGQDISEASLEYATLIDADFTSSVVRGTRFLGDSLTQAQLASTASYQSKDLHNIQFYDMDLSGWNFRDQNLTSASFGRSDLTNADFHGAILANTRFDRTLLSDGWSGTGINRSQLESTASYRNKRLQGVGLSGHDVSGWDFRGYDLTNSSFGSAILVDTDLSGAIVRGAGFERGRDSQGIRQIGTGLTEAQLVSTASYQAKDLQRIRLEGNNLTGWNFRKQDLSAADFRFATLVDADFTGAIVTGAKFYGAGFTANQLYSTASYRVKDLRGIGFGVNDLTGWNFREQDLTGANFISANLTNADFSGAWIREVEFRGPPVGFNAATLYSTASFAAKDLRGIVLWENSLSGWNFSDQWLIDAVLPTRPGTLNATDFSRSDLRGAIVPPQQLSAGILDQAILPDGHIHGLHLDVGETLIVRDDDGLDRQISYRSKRPAIPITVDEGMSMMNTAAVALRFDADSWGSGISFQPGITVQLGGTLELTFTDDTQLATQSGRTIKAFDWTGVNPQGQFTVAGQPGTTWDTSKLYTTGEVTLLGISSDLNADQDVDSEDLLDFLANWTGSEYPAADKTWQTGDSDQDGDVDSADMLVFLSQWTGAAAAEASRVASVPEPSVLTMSGIGIAALIAHLRRSRRKYDHKRHKTASCGLGCSHPM